MVSKEETVGGRCGDFDLLGSLGRGAQARVFLARRGEGPEVALKLFDRPDVLDAGALAAWRAAPEHPQLLALRAAGATADGRVWVVTDRLRGETLAARLTRGPLAVAEVCALGSLLADALALAHAAGVVHRDVKPANVFLCEGPALDPRLLDFGLAARARTPSGEGRRALFGTPAYLSPERAGGGDDPEPADDVWALAALLWEALTAVPLFAGRTLTNTLFRAAFWSPPPLARSRPDAPPALADALGHALEKQRARRLADARTLADALRAAAASSAPAAHPPGRSPPPGVAPSPRRAPTAPFAEAPLVGRSRELRALVDPLIDGRGRSPAARVVVGPRGVGKSRLLRAAAAAAAAEVAGLRVLRATGLTAGAASPFGPLIAALAQLAPDTASELRANAGAGDVQAGADRARAALTDALAALAGEGPVLLAIDDAELLDEASRRLVREVFRNPSEAPATLWLAGSTESLAALCELARAPEAVALAPLASAEAQRLATHWGASDPAALARRSEGNPLFLEALTRSQGAAEALPATVTEVLRAGLDALAPVARGFVARASLFGPNAWVEGVAALGGDAAAAPELFRAGVLEARVSRLAGRSELAFRSALLAEVARSLTPPDELPRLHRAAAAWLAAHDDADPAEVARLFDAGGDPAQAARWWTRAVESASAAGIVATARAAARRVLESDAPAALRWRVLTAQDDALQQAGDRAAQREVLAALAPLADALGPAARAELMWRRCHHGRMVGDPALAEASGRAALAALAAPNRWSVSARVELALLYTDARRLAEGRAEAEAARLEAPGVDDGWLAARADHALAYVTLEEGRDFDRGLALYLRAAAGYQGARDRRRESIARVNAAAALIHLGRFGEALDAYDEARALAASVGNARAAAVCLEGRGSVRRCLGELDGADDDLRAAQGEARALAHPRLEAAASVERAYLALTRGDGLPHLRERLAEVSAAGAEGVPVALRLRQACGDPDLAAAVAQARGDDPPATPAARFERAVALWLVDGGGDDDRQAAEAALAACVAGAPDAAGGRVRRQAVLRRFDVPRALGDTLGRGGHHPNG
jgi:hypothetical protein